MEEAYYREQAIYQQQGVSVFVMVLVLVMATAV
jgi:hypothetical protein